MMKWSIGQAKQPCEVSQGNLYVLSAKVSSIMNTRRDAYSWKSTVAEHHVKLVNNMWS